MSNEIDSIRFRATDGTNLSFAKWLKGAKYGFNGDKLFSLNDLQIGDVFVKGGRHAMIVVGEAFAPSGERMYLIAQTATPAQDIHIAKNPVDAKLGPWYILDSESRIITPEWIFSPNELKRW